MDAEVSAHCWYAGKSLLTSGEDRWIYMTSMHSQETSSWKCQGINELAVLSCGWVALLPYGENKVMLLNTVLGDEASNLYRQIHDALAFSHLITQFARMFDNSMLNNPGMHCKYPPEPSPCIYGALSSIASSDHIASLPEVPVTGN
jgi:hypothetical protein